MSGDPELDAIHAEFRAGLPARLAKMRSLAAEARAGARPEALAELRTVAHRLRGVCGSFGLNALEEPSRVLEAECKKAPSWEVVDRAIDDLTRLIGT